MVKITLNLHISARMNRSVEVIQKVQSSSFITSFTKEFCLHINPPNATSDGYTIFICMYYRVPKCDVIENEICEIMGFVKLF